jgi:hypothetical protein
VGNHYERDNGSTVRKCYYAGGAHVVMRTGEQTYYLLGDHLGGANVTANSSGVQISKLLYKPWARRALAMARRRLLRMALYRSARRLPKAYNRAVLLQRTVP